MIKTVYKTSNRMNILCIYVALFFSMALINTAGSQPITVVSQKSATSSASTLGITKPVGILAGDVMISHISLSGNNLNKIVAPQDWNLIRTMGTNSDPIITSLFYKVATSSEPVSYIFVDSSASPYPTKLGFIVAFRNVDNNNPVNAESGYLTYVPVCSTPAITTTADSCMVIAYYAIPSGSGFTFSGGSVIYSQGTVSSYEVAEAASNFLQPLAGYVPGQSVSTSYNGAATADLLALRKKNLTTATPFFNPSEEVMYIYPNPASNQLTIHTSSLRINEVATISVMNMLGEIIQEEKVIVSDKDLSISLKSLSSGIYFLQVNTETAVAIRKFIKE